MQSNVLARVEFSSTFGVSGRLRRKGAAWLGGVTLLLAASAAGAQCQPPDCDDQNPCTTDSCNPILGCVHVPQFLQACDDGNACTTGEVCDLDGSCGVPIAFHCETNDDCAPSFLCSGGVCVQCDDGNDCTADSCDLQLGCQNTFLPADTACRGDGSLCTTDVCDGSGTCTHQTKSCDDQNPCTIDVCNLLNGECLPPVPVVGPVTCTDDGNQCTRDECGIGTGVCNHDIVEAMLCDDGNPCTPESQCTADGACIGLGFGDRCNSNDECRTGYVCSDGICIGCDDGTVCTDDTCDPLSGCVHTPTKVGEPCETDEEPCTSDVCDDVGTCSYTPICDDGNPCTFDACSGGECLPRVPMIGAPCNDGDPCTPQDICAADGACTGLPCVDADPCTVESCDPLLGCVSTPIDCNDQNSCTDDFCLLGSCQHPPRIGESCDDGSVCTSNETCTPTGQCSGGGNPCDSDADCSTAYQCLHGVCGDCELDRDCPNGTLCLGNVCLPCNDNDACTIDSCDPTVGCQQTAKDCDDHNSCTSDSCSLGTCTHDPLPTNSRCNDGNPCTQLERCNAQHNCVGFQMAEGSECDDGDPCTFKESCDAQGACTGGDLRNCDDNNPCTKDTCIPDSCEHDPYPTGTRCNDGNPCTALERCSADAACSGIVQVGAVCDDAEGCTINDRCDAQAACHGQPRDCNDNNPCTIDFCFGGCGNVAREGAACDDGNPCTAGDTCNVNAMCVATPIPSCPPQSTPTATPTPPPTSTPTATSGPPTPTPSCDGDCNRDGSVTIDDVLKMVNIALGSAFVAICDAGDRNHDGEITIEEIIIAVNAALLGCPVEQVCNGIVGLPCPTGAFCELPAGMCNTADLFGICRPLPGACTAIVDPVCGCDGHTYGNDCLRQAAAVAKNHDGACT